MSKFIRSLDDIVGHKKVVSFLKDKIQKDSIPRVILFYGYSGIGKTSIAKILACTVTKATEETYVNIIDKNLSTSDIKLFNMSSVGDDTGAIVSELQSTSFTNSGKKAIILDEVHGMTKKAQDAILVELEHLKEGIYVFMCTTEITMLRETLQSRCTIFELQNLIQPEINQVIRKIIKSRNLSFNFNFELAISLIASWSRHQPRKAVNLLYLFEEGSTITKDDLSTFVSTTDVPIAFQVTKYLYSSVVQGLNFIESLNISDGLLGSLLELLKVTMGGKSNLVDFKYTNAIKTFFNDKDLEPFLKFVVRVNSKEFISKRVFTAIFLECHSRNIIRPNSAEVNFKEADNNTIRNIRNPVKELKDDLDNKLIENTLDELFADKSSIKE